METIYKEYSWGKWNYRVWCADEGGYYTLTREQANRMVERGHARIVTVN